MAEVLQASPAWDQPPKSNKSDMALASHKATKTSPSHPPALFFARGQTQSIFGWSAILGWCSVMLCFTETVRRTVFVVISIKMGPVLALPVQGDPLPPPPRLGCKKVQGLFLPFSWQLLLSEVGFDKSVKVPLLLSPVISPCCDLPLAHCSFCSL